jgi:hypothetical protein
MNIDRFISEDEPLLRFFRGYLEAMCFTSLPEDEVGSGEFRLWITDWSQKFSEEILIETMATCSSFLVKAHDFIPVERMEEAGRDLWYTRQGHGVGYWESEWENCHGAELTRLAEKLGETGMYVGDDGLLYLE